MKEKDWEAFYGKIGEAEHAWREADRLVTMKSDGNKDRLRALRFARIVLTRLCEEIDRMIARCEGRGDEEG